MDSLGRAGEGGTAQVVMRIAGRAHECRHLLPRLQQPLQQAQVLPGRAVAHHICLCMA